MWASGELGGHLSLSLSSFLSPQACPTLYWSRMNTLLCGFIILSASSHSSIPAKASECVGCKHKEKAQGAWQGTRRLAHSLGAAQTTDTSWTATLTAAPPAGPPRDLWAGRSWDSQGWRNSTGCPRAGREPTQASHYKMETTVQRILNTREQ